MGIIQNIRKDIYNFFWSYRKGRVNRNTITPSIEMGRLVIIDIEIQWEAIHCSILAKFIKKKNQSKAWIGIWHLDHNRKAKQGVSFFRHK